MEYLSVKEVAELKGCSERYIQNCISKGKLEAIEKLNAKGKIKFYVPISALPDDIRAKYNKQKQRELGLQPELKEQPHETALKQRSNAVKTPVPQKRLDEFTESEREEIAMWCDLLKEWQAARAKFKRRTEADPLFCAKVKLERGIDISPDILYRKYRAYCENDYSGIVDKRGGWNKGKSCIDDTVWSIFTSYYLTTHRLTVENCYAKAVAVCKEYYPELVCGIPSSRTFRRHAEKIPHAVLEYGRFGKKAFLDKYLEYVERDVSTLKVNDIWIADNHTLDFFTISDDGEVHRPSITTFQEAKSGVIVAAELCDHPNSDTTRLALRSAILQGYGMPIGVYFDNGSEFCASDLAGRGHRKKSSWQKEEHPVQIFSLLGISVTNAIPKNAKAKPIERFFYTFKEHYSKSVESYCGGKPDERPEECKQLVKEQKLITDAELREMLPIFIKGHNSELYGGKEKHYKNMKRIDVWNEAVRSGDIEFRTTDADNLNLLLRRTTKIQKIKRNGVFIEWAGRKIWYKDDNSIFHIDEEVYVRFDPVNLREVQVYEKDTDRFLYTYPCADHLNLPFIGASEESIQKAIQSQSRARKAVKRSLDDYRKFDAVSLLKAELLRAEQNSAGYEIAKPDSFTPVIANELGASGMKITNVKFADLKRLNDVQEKSKGA